MRLGLGTAPLGGFFAEVSPEAAADTVDAAWGLGAASSSTAPLYGSGLAEERLGQALTDRPRATNVVETAITSIERGDAAVVMLAGRYTLLDRTAAEELLPLCAERGVELLPAGIFTSGVLAGGTTFDHQAAAPAILEARRRLEQACARHDVPLAAEAIQFPLRHPAVTSILSAPGHRRRSPRTVRLLDHPVPEELWSELVIGSRSEDHRPQHARRPLSHLAVARRFRRHAPEA